MEEEENYLESFVTNFPALVAGLLNPEWRGVKFLHKKYNKE